MGALVKASSQLRGQGRFPAIFPVHTLDFEASGFGPTSYPIEIGVSSLMEPDAEIATWSCLIQPTDVWLNEFIWNLTSAEVHGIPRSELPNGLVPADALNEANRRITGGVAFCDGGASDQYWLRTLGAAAGIKPTFVLDDWDRLAAALGPVGYARAVLWLERDPAPHRAGRDATRLLEAIVHGMNEPDHER